MQANFQSKDQILLVDDEPQVLVALEDLLCDRFSILKSSSAENAMNMIAHERNIAVVITDQRMPKMSGDEFLTRLGGTSDATRILLTGYADLSAVIRAVNNGGIFAYVTKPWDPEDLRLRVYKAAEHFRLTKELAHERRLLRDLMNNIPDAIYLKDKGLRFLQVNPAFAALLDHNDADQFVGRRLAEFLADTHSDGDIEQEEARILKSGKPTLDVVRELKKAGEKRWLSETKAPIRNPEGEIIGLVGISRDVSERIATQEALRESEQRLRDQTRILNSILSSMDEGVIAVDREGQFLLFNCNAEKILGFGPNDVPAADWARAYGAYSPDQQTFLAPEQSPLSRAMAGSAVNEAEMFIRNANVAGSIVAYSTTPLSDHTKSVLGGLVVLRDVTQQRALEDQLRQMQKMEAIGHLAGGIAHDFNNMLAVIINYGELVRSELAADDSRSKDLAELLAAARRATALTRQLLAFSRRQVVQTKVIQLNDAVADIEKMLCRIIGEDIELITRLTPNDWSIRADPSQVEQVILNLTVNARDAMRAGGKLTIETANVVLDRAYATAHAGVEPGEFVRLSVTDTGIGMDNSVRKRIFEPFFTTKDVGKGTGLGLSTVYGIVQQSGGHIWVESAVGLGSTFHVYFPRVLENKDAAFAAEAHSPDSSFRGTILLVEDDDAVRQVVTRILRKQGHSVLETRHPLEAKSICKARGSEIDLLLTDVIMPEISGPKLAEELSVECPHLRVLYMSGYSAETALGTADLAQGAVGYLEKPFTPNALIEKVSEILSRNNEPR